MKINNYNRIQKGLKILESLYKRNPLDIQIHLALLKSYLNLGEIEKSLKLFDTLPLTLKPNFIDRIKFLEQNSYSNIKFLNFWNQSVYDFWLYNFVKHHNLDKKPLYFFSVFGLKNTIIFHKDVTKIFYTGENVYREFDNKYSQYQDYCLDYVDLSLGYEYIDHERYLRFPLWIKYLLPTTVTKDEIHKRILEINNPSYRLQNNRYKFACLIASHDPQPFIRQSIVDLLSSIAPIDCAGLFLNNTNELKTLYNDNKVTYLKQFKFNICSENSRRSGYVTEKLFESIISGCIPVYWGDINPEPDILNQDAILFFEQDIQSQNKLLQKTFKLWHNEKLYQEFCRIPPFKADATEVLWQKLETLATKLQQLTYPKDKQP